LSGVLSKAADIAKRGELPGLPRILFTFDIVVIGTKGIVSIPFLCQCIFTLIFDITVFTFLKLVLYVWQRVIMNVFNDVNLAFYQHSEKRQLPKTPD
jgi:hypothetical protein